MAQAGGGQRAGGRGRRGPLRGTSALAKTPKTPKTPRNVPGMCGVPRIGGPAASRLSRVLDAQAFACHVLEVLGVLLVLVRPLENGIPSGRAADWKRLETNGAGQWPG